MRIIFMGTPDFAVPAFEALLDAGHGIILAVTQPDRPKGRGKAMSASPVKEAALKAGTPVLQPENAKDPSFIDEIDKLSPDVCVVAAYGQILSADLLDIPRFGCVNIHASLLPRYRGASPIQWAVINGDEKSGVTTMLMDAGMDTGDILEQASVRLDPKETGESLTMRLSRLGAELIVSTLRKLEEGTIIPRPQDNSEATVVKKIDRSAGNINWADDAVHIERLIRGLIPWPGAYTVCDGKQLKIWGAEAEPSDGTALCGTVLKADGSGLCVQTGNGMLNITDLQLEGKKRLDASAFLRGSSLRAGSILGR